MNKKPTIHDVAKLADVSHATVTQALKTWGKASIKPATRARVMEAVAALGYRPSPLAQQLGSRKSKVILLPIGAAEEHYSLTAGGQITLHYNDMIAGTSSILHPIGYRVEPYYCARTREGEEELVALFHSGYFDALILPDINFAWAAEEIARNGGLVATYLPPIPGVPNLIHVPVREWWDHTLVAKELVRQKRFNWLAVAHRWPKTFSDFVKGMEQGPIQYELLEEEGRSRAEFINEIVRIVLEGSVDTIHAGDEFFAWEIFKSLHQSGIAVPERVTIVGCADARHIFKQLPLMELNYAERAEDLRILASALVPALAARTSSNFVAPPRRKGYRTRLQVLTAEEFHCAAQAELRRERLQGEIEAEILR